MYTKEFVICVVLFDEQLSLISSEYYQYLNRIGSYSLVSVSEPPRAPLTEPSKHLAIFFPLDQNSTIVR
jgi:hypothetical protein